MSDEVITTQGYPLWAAEVPIGTADQPLMTNEGEVVTEDLVDFIFPHTYRVIAWRHGITRDGAVVPVLAGAEGRAEQFYQYAEDREDAENLARLRIRERLRSEKITNC